MVSFYVMSILRDNKNNSNQALVAHTCNLNYAGSRGQENRGSKPAWANSS
jgi:hypothetical protein